MSSSPSLLSYAEAAEQVRLFILALADHGGLASGLVADGGRIRSIEKVLLDAALGRVLAEGIYADRDLPPFARSTRDGFACRSVEANTHQLLHRTRQVRAGETVAGKLGHGEVWEIMTGAAVPAGADAVFMVEHSEQPEALTPPEKSAWAGFQAHDREAQARPYSPDFVRLVAPRIIGSGENVVPRGAEARAGDLLVPPGTRMGAAQIALAAQCGYPEVAVASRPRVAVLSTGDELVATDMVPSSTQIRNSNSPMLAALVTAAGGEPVVLPVVEDNEIAVHEAIEWARSAEIRADLILFTGGISVGRFDLVEAGLTRAGARFFVVGVAIQPGKPVVFGQLPATSSTQERLWPVPFFGLPGNPISTAVTFSLFAAPLLAALGNDLAPMPRFAQARILGEWGGKSGLTRFLPAWCDFGMEPAVRLVPWHGSGDVAAYARSNCFLVIPAEVDEISEGSLVTILLS